MVSFRPWAWCTLTISCWRVVTVHLENVSLATSTFCLSGELGSHALLTLCAARLTQAYDKHTKTWGESEIRFAEYVKEISSTYHHIDETEKPKSLHLSCLNLEA